MLRRLFCTSVSLLPRQRRECGSLRCCVAAVSTSTASAARDALVTRLTALKEEYKGQGFDLADMHEAATLVARGFRDCMTEHERQPQQQRLVADDAALKAKASTLLASMKAYAMRMSNLQVEARAVQSEADAMLRLLWGSEASPRDASFATPPPQSQAPSSSSSSSPLPSSASDGHSAAAAASAAHPTPTATTTTSADATNATAASAGATTAAAFASTADFATEPPPPPSHQRQSYAATAPGDADATTRVIHASAHANAGNTAARTDAAGGTTRTTRPPVERVEAERVDEATVATEATKSSSACETEIEVETVEVGVADGGDDVAHASTSMNKDIDDKSITDMTRELYERGVDFADCLDARSLRQRYRDVFAGRVGAAAQVRACGVDGVHAGVSSPAAAHRERVTTTSSSHPPQQPDMPARPSYAYQHDWQYDSQHASTASASSNGGDSIAPDPYPNAERKMLDATRYIWQIKEEIAREKGVQASQINLWSGTTLLQDHKRMCDYPTAHNYPIEVRQKYDAPRST